MEGGGESGQGGSGCGDIGGPFIQEIVFPRKYPTGHLGPFAKPHAHGISATNRFRQYYSTGIARSSRPPASPPNDILTGPCNLYRACPFSWRFRSHPLGTIGDYDLLYTKSRLRYRSVCARRIVIRESSGSRRESRAMAPCPRGGLWGAELKGENLQVYNGLLCPLSC